MTSETEKEPTEGTAARGFSRSIKLEVGPSKGSKKKQQNSTWFRLTAQYQLCR